MTTGRPDASTKRALVRWLAVGGAVTGLLLAFSQLAVAGVVSEAARAGAASELDVAPGYAAWPGLPAAPAQSRPTLAPAGTTPGLVARLDRPAGPPQPLALPTAFWRPRLTLAVNPPTAEPAGVESAPVEQTVAEQPAAAPTDVVVWAAPSDSSGGAQPTDAGPTRNDGGDHKDDKKYENEDKKDDKEETDDKEDDDKEDDKDDDD